MKILASKQYSSEILKVMHKSITAKFGDICELGDSLTFYTEKDFNKFKNHFGFTGKVESFNILNRTENKYLDIYFKNITPNSYGVYLKGSAISGKDIYVSKLDKIFKSNGAQSFIKNGYQENQFNEFYEPDKISQMLEGKFKGGSVNKYEFNVPVIDLACGLRVKIIAYSSTTHITYDTL